MLVVVTSARSSQRETVVVDRIIDKTHNNSIREIELWNGDKCEGTVDLNNERVEILPTP